MVRPTMITDQTARIANVLVSFEELATFGIHYSRLHLRRLVKKGTFPAPVRPSEGRIAWRSCDIHEWLAKLPTGHIDRSPRAKKASETVAKARASCTAGLRAPRTPRLR